MGVLVWQGTQRGRANMISEVMVNERKEQRGKQAEERENNKQ